MPRGGYILSLVEVYFDESGCHEGSPVLCVAGYIIESEQAKLLTEEWTALLKPYGIDYFHMVDCAHGNKDFKKLSKTDCIAVAKGAIEIVKKRVARGVGAMVVAEEYQKLMPHHPNMGSAYTYCIFNCLAGVRRWIEETGYEGDIAYFFESGHKSQSEANRIMNFSFFEHENSDKNRNEQRYISRTFADKKKFAGLQAADLLAWQMFTDWRHGAESRPRRKDFAYLVAGKKHRVAILNANEILAHVEQMKNQNAWGEEGRPSHMRLLWLRLNNLIKSRLKSLWSFIRAQFASGF